jgi:hypothetical protein
MRRAMLRMHMLTLPRQRRRLTILSRWCITTPHKVRCGLWMGSRSLSCQQTGGEAAGGGGGATAAAAQRALVTTQQLSFVLILLRGRA